MKALLTDIELDIQELKCVVDALSREPSKTLRDVAKRNVLQMRTRLDAVLKELDALQDIVTVPVNSASLSDEKVEKIADVVPLQTVVPKEEVETSKSGFSSNTPILAERINPVTNLRSSISLNDSFRFSRELFGGDGERMNRVIHEIGEMQSLEIALAFLKAEIDVKDDNDTLLDLQELLKKYFSQ